MKSALSLVGSSLLSSLNRLATLSCQRLTTMVPATSFPSLVRIRR